MERRIQNLRESLSKSGLDAAVVTSVENIRYYSGFTSADGTALITHRGCYLVTDFRYTIQAKRQTRGNYEVFEEPFAAQMGRIRDLLLQDGCKRCGFEQDNVTVGAFRQFEAFRVTWVPFGGEIALPRLIKSDDEIAALQSAQRIADKSYIEWTGRIGEGMTEREAAAELNYVCAKNGSEGPAFDPIVATGANGAMCHAVPGENRLQRGDLVVVDFGCTYEGYRSDMTRTLAVGTANDESRRVYDIVLQAQLKALDALKGGVSGKALDAVARDYIAGCGYGEAFGHGLGHGFGLQIHEPPRAASISEDTLLPGMTITIEPGVYLEGKLGVRTEDCCVVTQEGHINLVSAAKDLLII